MKRLHNRDRMARTVEEIRIAERDVCRARRHLPPYVLQNDIALHDAERAPVNRNHRAMAAEVPAAARGLGIADAPRAVLHHQLRVRPQRRQALPVGHQKLLAVRGNHGGLRNRPGRIAG